MPSIEPVGIAELPNQRHRIVSKKGTTFTIMLVGETGLGKTTFVNTLFETTLKPVEERPRRDLGATVEISITRAELEEKGFVTKLNIVDTPGFGDQVNSKNAWQPIVDFIDDQHELYMRQEQQPLRNRFKMNDLRVHACLYFIRPTGHSLKPLDIEIMKRLSSRVNLIPVVAKADTLSPTEMEEFKDRIRAVIEAQGIRIYTPPIDPADPAAAEHSRALIEAMPFSVIASTEDVQLPGGRIVKGRMYLWGIAEVENEKHCDFKKLRNLLIRSHMLDLILSTEELHYESYRTQRLESRKFNGTEGGNGSGSTDRAMAYSLPPLPRRMNNPKFKEEEEALKKFFTEQVKAEEQRFRQWETNIVNERNKLTTDLEQTQQQIRKLEEEIKGLQLTVGQRKR